MCKTRFKKSIKVQKQQHLTKVDGLKTILSHVNLALIFKQKMEPLTVIQQYIETPSIYPLVIRYLSYLSIKRSKFWPVFFSYDLKTLTMCIASSKNELKMKTLTFSKAPRVEGMIYMEWLNPH